MTSGDWRDIATAPKVPLDTLGYGPRLLLFADGLLAIGMWDQDYGEFFIQYPTMRAVVNPLSGNPFPIHLKTYRCSHQTQQWGEPNVPIRS